MDEKKNPHSLWVWVVCATTVIQLLTAVEYYNMYRSLHDQVLLQKTCLEYQVESLKAVNQSLTLLESDSCSEQ